MLKYLIIPLSKSAISFCHYEASDECDTWISSETLKSAINWAMKENLSIQFVYPHHKLPDEISTLVDTVENVKIVPIDVIDNSPRDNADIVVFNDWKKLDNIDIDYVTGQSYVIRTTFSNLISNELRLINTLKNVDRVTIVLIDIENVDSGKYQVYLQSLIPVLINEYKRGHPVQFNLLTDRLMLEEMNNCNAGYESLTLAPDGNFYICPAFWHGGGHPIGNLNTGLDLKNPQLYKLSHAPICRECDAWQCKRCVWLNKKLTREVNTPSHQQCVMSHIERNVSKLLLAEFRKIDTTFLSEVTIPEINYLDPFDKLINKQTII